MAEVFNSAVRLLARREHGARELADKLTRKGFGRTEVSEAIAECQRLGLQSDERFVESFCRVRIHQGSGPLKISQELQAKHIEHDLIESTLDQEQANWVVHALAVWHKKYKNQNEISFNELQKRQRFLLYRGFSSETIAAVIAELNVVLLQRSVIKI